MQYLKRAVFPLFLLASASVSAQVTYTFDALSSYPVLDSNNVVIIPSITGSFSLTVPTFITSDTKFTPDELTSCSVSGGLSCDYAEFTPAFSPTNDVVTFGTINNNNTNNNNPSNYGFYYYFNLGDFSTLGTHDTTALLGADQAAILTVSAVPEPSTYALMLAGLGSLALSRIWRKRKSPFIASPA